MSTFSDLFKGEGSPSWCYKDNFRSSINLFQNRGSGAVVWLSTCCDVDIEA